MKITVSERFLREATEVTSQQLEGWLQQAVEKAGGRRLQVAPVATYPKSSKDKLYFEVTPSVRGDDLMRKVLHIWAESHRLEHASIGEWAGNGRTVWWLAPATASNVRQAAERLARDAAYRVEQFDLSKRRKSADEIEACFYKRLEDVCQEQAKPSESDLAFAPALSTYGLTAGDVRKKASSEIEELLADLVEKWQRKVNPPAKKGLDQEMADKVVEHTIDYLDESDDLRNYIFDMIDNAAQLEAKAGKMAADEVDETLRQVRFDWDIPRSVKAAQVKAACTPALWDKLLKQIVVVGKSYLGD